MYSPTKYVAVMVASLLACPAWAQDDNAEAPIQEVEIPGDETISEIPEADTLMSPPGDFTQEEPSELPPEEGISTPESEGAFENETPEQDESQNSAQSFVPQPPTQSANIRCDESMAYPNTTIRRAETAYTKRRYSTVIETLRPIYENLRCVEDTDTIIEIYLLLGVSFLELGQTNQADNFFLNVLYTDPDYDPLGAIIMLPRSSTERIELLRTTHAAELDSLRNETTQSAAVETLFVPGETEKRPYWINFVPMGAGMFQMHHNMWGGIYASLQTAGILMSIMGGGMVEFYRKPNYLFSSQDYKTANKWQTVQIIGISMLGASYLASVLHALIIYEEAPINWLSPTKAPPAYAQIPTPFLLPDGAGLAYGAQF